MISRKLRVIAVGAAMAIALTACSAEETAPDRDPANALKVGVLLSLSGINTEAGRTTQQGIKLAIKEIDESGILGDQYFEAVVEDDGTDPQQAVTLAQKLVSDEVVACVCGALSNVVAASLPILNDAGVPYLAMNSYALGLVSKYDYGWQISQPTSIPNQDMTKVVVDEFKIKKAAILYGQDIPTTVGFNDDYLKAFEEAGVDVVLDEGMDLAEVDHSAQLRSAIDKGAELLVTDFTGPVNAAVLVEAKELGFTGKHMGHIGDIQPDFTKIGGDAGVGQIANTGYLTSVETEPNKKFNELYTAEYGESPDASAAQGYTATWALAHAIDNFDKPVKSAQDMQDALSALGEFPVVLGTTGTAVFTDRVITHDGVLVQFGENLEWELWTP